MLRKIIAGMATLLLSAEVSAAGAAPPVDTPPADPFEGYSFGQTADTTAHRALNQRPFMFRNMDELTPYPVHLVRHGDYLRPLPKGAPIDVNVEIDGHRENIDSFMVRYHTAGLIVVKDGMVVAERYRYGNSERSRWNMQSITKSLNSTALAAAIQDGKISSVEDQIVKYIPELKGSAYDGDRIRDLLNMTSGIDRADVYDSPAEADKINGPNNEAYFSSDPKAVFAYLRTLKRKAPPGTWFAYDGMDSFVLAEVVRRATGETLANYISEKIWKPGGMEDDAVLRTTNSGLEVGHGGLNATLRDIARFGMFCVDGGFEDGKQIIPVGWFEKIAMGEMDPKHIRAPGNTSIKGYGYTFNWWNVPHGGSAYELGDDGGFVGLGAWGQELVVVPKQHLVVVVQTVDFQSISSAWQASTKLATAIAQQLHN